MSPPELPEPTTAILLSVYSPLFSLNSTLCCTLPLNLSNPGILGICGAAWWPLQTRTALNVLVFVPSFELKEQ
jgi:hypothetical protein